MSPRGNLMERLAAADPRPDAERLGAEEQSEADALLARLLATPHDGQAVDRRVRPRRVRRLALVATGALCSAAAAFAALNLLDSDAPGPDVVEQAVAAVTRAGVVYHVVERSHVSATGTPDPARMTIFTEYWHTTGGRYHAKTYAARGDRRGRLRNDMAGRRLPGRRGGPALLWTAGANTIVAMGYAHRDPSKGAPGIDYFTDPGARLRALEEQSRLRLAGTTRFADRRAYRLVSGVVPSWMKGGEESVEFLVDSETYLPLAERRWLRSRGGAEITFRTRYLVYEHLPLNARSREQLDLDPHPGARCAQGTGDLKGRRAPGFPNPCARSR
jgi:hypothetical protein